MSHIPYYGEDENNKDTQKKKSRSNGAKLFKR